MESGAVRRRGWIIPALAGNTAATGLVVGHDGDHPRSRGEYNIHQVACETAAGSSPLSRGIPSCAGSFVLGRGIIPALAGNTKQPLPRVKGGSDHPRSRGEYWVAESSWGRQVGSSPLSRGILVLGNHSRERPRIIPALAGNTFPRRRRARDARDHPRSRGEYARWSWWFLLLWGSSPLSRGIRTPPAGRSRP